MPKNRLLRKVMVIGSGPIIIGQAAEFDYAGTQACQTLKKEGVEVVLVNSNPATIMTDTHIADRIYIEPLTVDFLTEIIRKERPDGLLATLGGQTALNLALQLSKQGVLSKEKVNLLGTDLDAIICAEDRLRFRELMYKIGEPVPSSTIVYKVSEALDFAKNNTYPLIVRPACTLGGTGGGIAYNPEMLREIVERGIKYSPIGQCLIEESIAGYKEIEYEVMRDAKDTCIVVCNMENFDPVGVHTGDSIVFAPSQTLSDIEHHMLRTSALKIIRALGIEGGCNVQFAFNPHKSSYYVIEVNPRVSRSSALASKATGYPIAMLATKIALGYTLDELKNPVINQTFACFEPTLDYVVTKIPRWPFDKFSCADRSLGTQMKSTGEVMAIGRSLEESLLKAVRSLEINLSHPMLEGTQELTETDLRSKLRLADDERLFLIMEWFRRNLSLNELHAITHISHLFLHKLRRIVFMENELSKKKLYKSLLLDAKRLGFADQAIARFSDISTSEVRKLCQEYGVEPVYKMVDTCAAEFEAQTPYFYSTYENEDEVTINIDKERVVVLGSGPIRIGQGVEFDYTTVHAIWAIQEAGYEAVVINSNPETVSTDFCTSDRLYFEPLVAEEVRNVIHKENPIGVVIQFGGQTAINLARDLSSDGIRLLGTSMESIDLAEDRAKFEQLLRHIKIAQPLGTTVESLAEAKEVTKEIGYPVLVRPSYVIGGRAMEIIYNEQELADYISSNSNSKILVDRYLLGKELEVDAISDGKDVLVVGIMEHIERSGVHSGDSIAVYPPQSLTESQKTKILEITTAVSKALGIRGLLNIQFVLHEGQIYVLEVNPRASRTVPILSKMTGVPIAQVATSIMLGQSLQDQGYQSGLYPESAEIAVKVPVFSFAKLRSVDVALGPEMKSTGEVMGRDTQYARALYKGLLAAGVCIPRFGTILATIGDNEKQESIALLSRFYNLGYRIVATEGTAAALCEAGLEVDIVCKLTEGSPNILDLVRLGEVDLVINTLTKGKGPLRDGFRIRREAVEHGIICLTSLDTVGALLATLESIYICAEPLRV